MYGTFKNIFNKGTFPDDSKGVFWHRVEKVIRTAQFHSAKPICALRLEICDGKNL